MRIDEYSVFRENIIQEQETIVISENISVNDKIKEEDELFQTKNTLIETIVIRKENPDLKLFHLFNDRISGDGRTIEKGRIKFLRTDRFPDGCFLLIDTMTRKIKCFICELKHSAGDKISLIAEQFYSGYLHCKAFLNAIDLERDYEVSFEYIIAGFKRESVRLEKQLVANGAVKSSPGVPPNSHHEVRAYQRFKTANTICFSYTNDFSRTFDFTFEHICLKDRVYDSNQESIELREEYIINF